MVFRSGKTVPIIKWCAYDAKCIKLIINLIRTIVNEVHNNTGLANYRKRIKNTIELCNHQVGVKSLHRFQDKLAFKKLSLGLRIRC